MGAHEALIYCLSGVDGATTTENGVVVAHWQNVLNDQWIDRLSDGERALVWSALQLYNGGRLRDWPTIDLHYVLTHLDGPNRQRFVEAIGVAYDQGIMFVGDRPFDNVLARSSFERER